MIELKPISYTNVEFVYECLKELRGNLNYSLSEFTQYLEENLLLDHPNFLILVGSDLDTCVGMITCNRFAIPRYMGFGYELEEVIVHPNFQSKGYGKALIESFLQQVKSDVGVRKVIVKTDDRLKAGKLYERYFGAVDVQVYSKVVNYL